MKRSSLFCSSINVAAVTGLLLLVPFIAMRFSSEVTWSAGDFAVAGALLFGAGMTYVVAARRAQSSVRRIQIALFVLVILGVVWAELAVGIFR